MAKIPRRKGKGIVHHEFSFLYQHLRRLAWREKLGFVWLYVYVKLLARVDWEDELKEELETM